MGTSVFAKSLSAGFMSVSIGPGWTVVNGDAADTPAFAQMPRGFLCRNEQPADIDGDQLLEIFKRELLNGREDTSARVVHENINGPECPDGFGNRQSNSFCIGGVGLDRQRLSARRFNRAHDFIGLVG